MNPFIGQIQPLGFNFAPRGWALCEGQLLPINSYQALFSLIGTIYGGDGRTTLGLPDLRGRRMIHHGDGAGLPNYDIGAKGGQSSVVLNNSQLPAHSHSATIQAASGATTSGSAGGNVLGNDARSSADIPDIYVSGATPDVAMHPNTMTLYNTGSSLDHNNMEPYNTVNISIALVGLFPSRN